MNIRLRIVRLLSLTVASMLTVCAQADVVDVSSIPLIVSSPSSVQPNLMFVLDDSGSMNFDYLPDLVNGTSTSTATNPSGDIHLCRSKGATSPTATGVFDATCCTNNSESTACWVQAKSDAAPFANRAHPPFLAAGFNGLAYNPETRYLPPVDYTGTSAPNVTNFTAVANDYYGVQSSTTIDLTSQFPDLEWCTVTTPAYQDCLRNGNYVLPGTVNGKAYTTSHVTTGSGTGSVAMGAPENAGVLTQVTFGPYYYRIVPNEYCDDVDLRNCQVGSGGAFVNAAKVRWCNSNANSIALTPVVNSCQAVPTSTFRYPRYPTKYPSDVSGGSGYIAAIPDQPSTPGTSAKATYTVALGSGCTGGTKVANVSQLSIGGINVMVTGSGGQTSASAMATNIAKQITQGNFSATASSAKFTVVAPIASGSMSGVTTTPTYTVSGSNCTFSLSGGTYSGYVAPTPFVAGTPATLAVAGVPAARFERVDIISGQTYPKGADRKDCAGSTCTYNEEMTNFANWWTYYHSRMQMMKTSTTLAFNGVPTNYRVGYMTINNNGGSAFLNPLTFGASSTARQNWWTKLKAANPSNSTPLRTALTTIGRYYGGQLTTVNSVKVVDPMQYSCQRNFLLLSTDGFWNETNLPMQLDGLNPVGDQDGTLARPQYDGNGVSNTLADTAAYYYGTDLRTGTDPKGVCASGNTDDGGKYKGNDVCGDGDKSYSVQRLSTYTLGLGASGFMQFRDDYLTAPNGDYAAVLNGSTPSGTVCTWQTSGACTWPKPNSNTLTTIDDLWHAAVNGHGTYFSAINPTSLYQGLTKALSAIDDVVGASAAVTTSVPNITATDNQAFLSNFGSDTSGAWYGDLQAHKVVTSTDNDANGVPGVIGTINSTADWSASVLLNASTSRNIYMYKSDGNHLRNFAWAELTDTEKAYFSTNTMVSGGLMQFCATGTSCLSSANQTAAGTQTSSTNQPVVDYLRGDRSNEGDVSSTGKYFRVRKSVLGDIVDSEAAFVGQPTLHLSDAGYSDFKSTKPAVDRKGTVYVGANDGMLHAFDSASGQEIWAYVPTAVLPNLYKLVDKAYATKHTYFVDGSPVVRDFYDGTQWHTILVCGLGAGGRSYFAIDVTDPTKPLPLWEFTDTNLGYTFGKAEVAKLTSGEWVVMLPSGYNNVSPGDGVARLYVLNALTGKPATNFTIDGVKTASGANMGHIRAWADNADIDNTAQRVYGGDNLGNLWRFDVNGIIDPNKNIKAQLLATLKGPDGITAQPITTRPELGQVGPHAMVFVGTGRYMGLSDIGVDSTQSIYGIKDPLSATGYGSPRSSANKFVQQTLATDTCPANLSICTAGSATRSEANPLAVDLSTNDGWYVDLPAKYERDNTDPSLVGGILVVNTNVIDNSKVCSVGGSSWQNFFDYSTGGAAPGNQNVASISLGSAIATRANVVAINGKLYTQTTLSNDTHESTGPLTAPNNQTARRTSWRELPTQ